MRSPTATNRRRRRLLRPALILVLAAIPAAAADAQNVLSEPLVFPTAHATEPKPAVVPFEMLPSNHMVIEAKLNGEGPFRLIFDLGSPVFLLSNRAAHAAHAIPDDAPTSFLFGARGEGELASLTAGSLEASNLPVLVMDHPAVKALGDAIGKPLDGIVGYTFFARFRTTIDYQKRQMTFTPAPVGAGGVRNLVDDLPGKLLGPKTERTRTLAPAALFGLDVADPPPTATGPEAQGVTVSTVHDGGPAAAAGVRPGDVLLALDGRWTTRRADAFAAAAACHAGRPVTLDLLRDGAPLSLTITPTEGL